MGRVVGEMRGDAGEEVLEILAGQEVAVAQRRLAELGEQRVPRPLEMNAMAAIVLGVVTDIRGDDRHLLPAGSPDRRVINRYDGGIADGRVDGRIPGAVLGESSPVGRTAQQGVARIVHLFPLIHRLWTGEPVDKTQDVVAAADEHTISGMLVSRNKT